jgi:acetyl esterase/lipase
MAWLIVLALLIWGITRFYLQGEDLRPYDYPRQPPFSNRPPSPEHYAIVERLSGFSEVVVGVPRKQHLALMRNHMDGFGRDVAFDGEIIPWSEGAVKGEWLVAPNANTTRRMLYIHGGAFVMGSSMSHRAITTRFAKLLGGAVLAIDYRLMPENRRIDGIDDCRAAYHWILNHGPTGSEPAQLVYIAGDSAGGNLTLSLSAWIRDQGLRAPDAVVALSPATDSNVNSPSMLANIDTDPMLGPQFGKYRHVPKQLMWWTALLTGRISPASPVVSPVYGDLSGLPPTLVHASEDEMLVDDSRRYVNKARAQGSPATLQTWPNMVHVWQFFESSLPEAEEAFEQIQQFLEKQGALPKLEKSA